MNDRIRELIYKSGNGQLYDGKIYPHLGSRTTDDWERFAKMIVQECIDQIRLVTPMFQENDFEEGAKWAFKESILAIEEHFGVE